MTLLLNRNSEVSLSCSVLFAVTDLSELVRQLGLCFRKLVGE